MSTMCCDADKRKTRGTKKMVDRKTYIFKLQKQDTSVPG